MSKKKEELYRKFTEDERISKLNNEIADLVMNAKYKTTYKDKKKVRVYDNVTQSAIDAAKKKIEDIISTEYEGLFPGKKQIMTYEQFNQEKEEAKKDFDKACDLYRSYVGSAETQEERLRRIHTFRCG